MNPRDIFREILFPLTNASLVMAIVFFGSLIWLVAAAGLLGLWLAFIVVPAVFRYGIYVLEARAHGDEAFVPGIEIFNIADNGWGLFPLAVFIVFIWVEVEIATNMGMGAAQAALAIFFLIYPASMAVLGITRSPVASLNPVALFNMVKTCGVNYVWIPGALTAVAVASIKASAVLPDFLDYYLEMYLFFLFFTFTGAVVHTSGAVDEVDIELPVGQTESEYVDDLTAERQQVANHAYGFISRGNREGGFKHIRQWIQTDPDPDDAVGWFFNEMMRWEEKDAALFFGQECLSHYLHHDQDSDNEARALKLMARCLHENPGWKPKAEDRSHATALADKYLRDDLLLSLRR